MKELGEISDIALGTVLNRKKAYSEEIAYKKYKLFSIKGYEESNYEDFYSVENLDGKCAQKGDVLFRLTYPNKIIYFDSEIREEIIIPSQFCIIRTKNEDNYQSSFIKIFLETEDAKNQIRSNINGTTVKSITVAELKKIKIPEVDSNKQKELGEIICLWEEQKRCLEKLIEDKQYFFDKYIEENLR